MRAVELLDYYGSGSARYFLTPKGAKFPSRQSWRCTTSEAFLFLGKGKLVETDKWGGSTHCFFNGPHKLPLQAQRKMIDSFDRWV